MSFALKISEISEIKSRAHNFSLQVITQEKIYQAQVELEQQHKAEEDRLMNEYQLTKQQETEKIKKEVDQEWEVRLKELTAQFDQDLTKRGTKRDLKVIMINHYKTSIALVSSIRIELSGAT